MSRSDILLDDDDGGDGFPYNENDQLYELQHNFLRSTELGARSSRSSSNSPERHLRGGMGHCHREHSSPVHSSPVLRGISREISREDDHDSHDLDHTHQGDRRSTDQLRASFDMAFRRSLDSCSRRSVDRRSIDRRSIDSVRSSRPSLDVADYPDYATYLAARLSHVAQNQILTRRSMERRSLDRPGLEVAGEGGDDAEINDIYELHDLEDEEEELNDIDPEEMPNFEAFRERYSMLVNRADYNHNMAQSNLHAR